MIGYLWAIERGADCIIDTDDDNIPKDNYRFPPLQGNYDCILPDKGFVNIYNEFTDQNIWPRGLPLNLICAARSTSKTYDRIDCQVGIWQGLADEDPDVDAIYRLTINNACYFAKRDPIVLGQGTVCPFNSQNTLICQDLFALLYLPTTVTFRFTDILRGLVAQPIMWLYGFQLGFTAASVVQKRNPHDYMKDFVSEIPMYLHSDRVVDVVKSVIHKRHDIGANLYKAYSQLSEEGIVAREELEILEAWLSDLKRLQRGRTAV
jgi:hypothetical protein